MNQINEFITTKEYKRFAEFCNACKVESYIGLCYGPAGVGKSMAAYHFAKWEIVERELKSKSQNFMDYKHPSVVIDDFDTVLYLPEVTNSPNAVRHQVINLICDFEFLVSQSIHRDKPDDWLELVRERVKLLIIDEADRLQSKSLEQIRDFYDRHKIAVIFIGMPGIEKRLVRFPQLYSRIGFAHAYKPLCEEETAFIIKNHLHVFGISMNTDDFTDQEAIAAITRITQGNFRLINRLLKQATRIMKVNQLSSIRKEVIDAARECLVIGNIY
jgi:DNA transposition AAA+ family ATPase